MAKARIVEIKAAGAVVLLENNEKAWLPAQELSTRYITGQKLTRQELCSPGQELEVMVYGKELGGKRKLVSHIRIGNDPWYKVKSWKDGDAREMKIHSVTANRAYGSIESGITGFVELAEIYEDVSFPRSWKHFKHICVGDIIAGCVKTDEIDSRNRLVKLNTPEYLRNMEHIPGFLPILKKGVFNTAPGKEANTRNHWDWLTFSPTGLQNILVVDDDELFLHEMSSYLESCDIKVTRATSGEEIMKFLEDPECRDFDAAILDIHLAKDYDAMGFQVAVAIARTQPRCRIIMTTGDPFEAEKMPQNTDNLLISDFLYKPFGVEELSSALSRAMTENPQKIIHFFRYSFTEEQEEFEFIAPEETRPLSTVVSDIKKEIEAEIVMVFSIHPLSCDVRIEAHSGIYRDRADDYLPKLRYSPVKDVAVDEEIIFEDKITGTPKYSKHRWLVKALAYESCIGFPIPFTHELKYCLFAFHGNEAHFDDIDRYKVKSTADQVARLLEIQRLEETIRSENPFYLAGKTYGSMAHDLVNALNREFGLPAIFKIIEAPTAIGPDERTVIRKQLDNFRRELKRAQEIVETFRRMSRCQHEKETEVNVFETVQRAAEIIKVETEALNTEIIVNPMAGDMNFPGKIKLKKTPFEQVLYNLFLNAAQQVNRFSFAREKGYIMVEFAVLQSDANEDNKNFLQLLIHDSGPGIHARDFEKIFQKGYTTKEDGCGLGLDICRNIIKQAGGKIRVMKSILFCGTTFELLLPFHTRDQET